MPISVKWADEHHTIVCYTFEGRWTWDELDAVIARGESFTCSVDHRVDVIANVLDSGSLPPDVMAHIKRITSSRSPNVCLVVIITQSATARTLYSVASRIQHQMGEYYRLADTVEEACWLIAQARLAMMVSET